MAAVPKPAYDASIPGAGAQRVIGIAQLYVRLTHGRPLTVTVADALCLVFGAGGATVAELASYLGLSENAVVAGLEGIPADMRCTWADLEEAADGDGGVGGTRASGATEDPYYEGDGEEGSFRDSCGAKSRESRVFLNYKRILVVAYAHLSHMLLALCVSPLPESPYTEEIRRSRAGVVVLPTAVSSTAPAGKDPSEGEATVDGLLSTTLNLSPSLRRKEALDGVYCAGCQFYYSVHDFARTGSRCPTCQQDVLRSLVLSMKARADALYHQEGRSLVVVPNANTGADAPKAATDEERQASPVSSPVGPTRPTGATATAPLPKREAVPLVMNCPLARDPFLLQQALAFLFLYSTPFACLSDARFVVDPNDILTELEYEKRLCGRASIADEFRAVHRNANKVRVRLTAQRRLDEALREENARKMAKRANLPPWLRHSTTLAALVHMENAGVHASASTDPNGSPRALLDLSADDKADDAMSTLRQRPTAAEASVGVNESKRARDDTTGKPVFDRETQLLSQARFVAKEFFEDDFDAVLLPRHLPRWE